MSMQPPPSGYPPQGWWQPPPEPPRKSWPARHKVWTAILAVVGVFVVLGIVGAVVGAPKGKPASAGTPTIPAATKVSSSPAPSPTLALTGAQSDYASAVQAAMAADNMTGVTDQQIVNVGEQLCTALKSGASQETVLKASKETKTKLGIAPRKFVRLTEHDLCRQFLPKVLIRFSGNGILNSAPFNVTTGTVTAHYSYNCGSFGQGNFIADMTDGSDDQSIANALSTGGSQTTTLYPTDAPGQYHLTVDSECNWTIVLISG